MIGVVVVFVILICGIFLLAISNMLVFQNYEVLFYFATLILLIGWYFGIFKNMKNIKKQSITPSFANPEGENTSELNNLNVCPYSYNQKTITILASTITLLIVGGFFGIFYFEIHSHHYENIDKNNIRNLLTPQIETLADKADKYYEAYSSYGAKDVDNLEWSSVFSGVYSCFSNEYIAQQKYLNSRAYQQDLEKVKQADRCYLTIQLDAYEFWIDPSNNKHYKLRYNPDKMIRPKFINLNTYSVVYDVSQKKFVSNKQRVKRYFSLSHKYLNANVWNISDDVGLFVYDSETKKFQFEHENAWDNFLENYKLIFFLFVYLITFTIAYLVVKLAKHTAAVYSDMPGKKLRKLTYN